MCPASQPGPPPFQQTKIAVVYDFDGTLTPQPMQEYTVLPELGIPADEFWKEVKENASSEGGDEMLTYMRLFLEKMVERKIHIGKEDLSKLAENINYYPGVESWFDRINSFVRSVAPDYITVSHYIISAGLKEIIDGTEIRKHFEKIYASEYHYDFRGIASFAKRVVNGAAKTQFIFEINKGTRKVNDYMPEEKRAVPFSNILYIGDGMTDVPCMTVTKHNGGFAVAVYREDLPESKQICRELLRAGRIDFFAPADYSGGKELEKRVNVILNLIIAGINHRREVFYCRNQLSYI